MKHQQKTQRAPQKHGSRRKKKTMRRRPVRSNAKNKTGGSNAADIGNFRKHLERLLCNTFRNSKELPSDPPTIQELKSSKSTVTGSEEWEDYFNAIHSKWDTSNSVHLSRKLKAARWRVWKNVTNKLKKDETKTQDEDQETLKKEQYILKSTAYKKVTEAIEKLHISDEDADNVARVLISGRYHIPKGPNGDDLKDLKDNIEKLETLVKEKLGSDTRKQWLEETLKKEIHKINKGKGLVERMRPPASTPDQSTSDKGLPEIGSFILLKTKIEGSPDAYGMKLSKVTDIDNDEAIRYVVCDENNNIITDETYNDKLLGEVTLRTEDKNWERASPQRPIFVKRELTEAEYKEITKDHTKLAAHPSASAPATSGAVASAPPATGASGASAPEASSDEVASAAAPTSSGAIPFTLRVIPFKSKNKSKDETLVVDSSATVNSVKKMIQTKMDIKVEDQVLLSGGAVLGRDPLNDETNDDELLDLHGRVTAPHPGKKVELFLLTSKEYMEVESKRTREDGENVTPTI